MTLKPDCESKASFLAISPAPAPLAWLADISASTAPILAILVSVSSFFISFLKWLVCGLSFSRNKIGKFQALISSSPAAAKPAASTAEAPKATAAKSTSTTKAITATAPKSSTAAGAIKATALKALEPLA